MFDRYPAFRGGLLALGAAGLFGASTPLVQRAGQDTGPFATAAALYLGAAAAGALLRAPVEREAALRRSDLRSLVLMALFGAVAGPVLLAWGLQHGSATGASLLLTLEAAFTAVLARGFYGEVMDRRVWAAMLLLTAGGGLLIVGQGAAVGEASAGLLAVLGATACWGVDNTLSRTLAERDPGRVVLAKCALGAAASACIAWAAGERGPGVAAGAALLVIGAGGYGLSLRLYLLAQRAFGAARTGSVFAFAPFIGALLAYLLGDRSLSPTLGLGAAAMLAGVLLHLSESHGHLHDHEAMTHEHAHGHDDGHHLHRHETMPAGPHSHPHQHPPLRHAHPHVPDLHHGHSH
jgi:drug/metabolite transporter (DMT)-like permease